LIRARNLSSESGQPVKMQALEVEVERERAGSRGAEADFGGILPVFQCRRRASDGCPAARSSLNERTADGGNLPLAARVAATEAGMIYIGPETARRIEGRITTQEVGQRQLKNVRDEVMIHRVVGDAPD
jgi:hypothetical protein